LLFRLITGNGHLGLSASRISKKAVIGTWLLFLLFWKADDPGGKFPAGHRYNRIEGADFRGPGSASRDSGERIVNIGDKSGHDVGAKASQLRLI